MVMMWLVYGYCMVMMWLLYGYDVVITLLFYAFSVVIWLFYCYSMMTYVTVYNVQDNHHNDILC